MKNWFQFAIFIIIKIKNSTDIHKLKKLIYIFHLTVRETLKTFSSDITVHFSFQPVFDSSLVKLVWSFSKQSFLKQILTEGNIISESFGILYFMQINLVCYISVHFWQLKCYTTTTYGHISSR